MTGARLNEHHIVPDHVQRLLKIGLLPPSIETLCHNRQITIWSFDDEAQVIRHTVGERVDAVLLSPVLECLAQLNSLFERFQQILASNGYVAIILPGVAQSPWTESEWDTFLSEHCWIRYHQGKVNSGNNLSPAWGITVVRQSYNPVSHARELAALGRPDCAVSVLNGIPEQFIDTDESEAYLAVEKQRHYLKWQQLLGGKVPAHSCFSKERREFGQATLLRPDLSESYRIHSRFWAHIGRADMAARTLRSIEHASPHPQTRHMLQVLQSQHSILPEPGICKLPAGEWQAGWPVPRILVITHDYSDYGMDTLYHGLCTVIGKDNVVEYPWKPTLHGQHSENADNYPCVFDYTGTPATIDELVLQLQAGCFDFILFGDAFKMEHREEVRRLVNAVPDLPVVVYDTWDDCYTPMDLILHYIDRPKVDLIFKREMLAGVAYGADTYPLPFGYQENFGVSDTQLVERADRTPFWLGKKEYGLRPLYVRRLESIVGHSLEGRIDQSEYRQKLRTSLIGLSFFGSGFDTVRYWELPANGVMLLAERPPIVIPDNFEENVSAVFFDDLADMEAKLDYYLNRPDEAAQIAANGHRHYRLYHTTTARARRFLGIVCHHLWKSACPANNVGKQHAALHG